MKEITALLIILVIWLAAGLLLSGPLGRALRRHRLAIERADMATELATNPDAVPLGAGRSYFARPR